MNTNISKCFSHDEQILRTGIVIERFSELEKLVDKIIFDFISPTTDAEEFVSINLLHTSILSFASKVKLLQVINNRKNTLKINREKFHRLFSIRNAFAHNNVSGKIEVEFPENERVDLYFYLESMKGNGEISRVRRDEAYEEFDMLHSELTKNLNDLLDKLWS